MASDDYEVGYGKPPRHTQFPPGKSGNPRGRRKGSRGLKTDLHAELSATHTITINGRPIKGSRQQLMVKTLATRAASGDLKAQALLLPLILQVFGIEDRGGERERLSAADQALLDQLLADGEPQPIEQQFSSAENGTADSAPVSPAASDAPDNGDDDAQGPG